jgi:uncharacterized protein (DUF849 family)
MSRDAAACVAAGAGSIHVHPRDRAGIECADGEVVDAVVRQVREACGVEISVTTGAWIEPDLSRRLELIRRWREPDAATVNVSEEGSFEVMEALLAAGIAIEAGVWTVRDAERLAESGLGDRILRVLIEPVELAARKAVAFVNEIHVTLDGLGLTAARLQHGDGDATWILIRDAIARRLHTRVGLEDTLYDPTGQRTSGNAALVAAAHALGAGEEHEA